MTISPFDDPAALVMDFDDPEPATSGDPYLSGGRYRFPNRDGSPHKGGWTRVTNLVGALSDQYRLNLWQLRCLVTGLALDGALYVEACALVNAAEGQKLTNEHQEAVNDLLERAKDAAGAGKGAKLGTRKHAMVEAHHTDIPFVTTAMERIFLARYVEALERHNLEALPGFQERRVMIEWANAVGTLDNVLHDLASGLRHIGDLKSQKRFWSYMEVEAQLAGYANADAMWDPVLCEWVNMPPGLDKTQGAVLWMPDPDPELHGTSEPFVDVARIDLVRGWETFKMAHAVHTRRSEAGRKRQAVSGTAWTPVVPALETWAKRLRDVSTWEEGSRVWAEAIDAGAVCPELRQVAIEVAARFSPIRA